MSHNGMEPKIVGGGGVVFRFTSERRKRRRPDCPASLIHLVSVKRDSHKILTPEAGRLVLAKLLTKEEKAEDGQRTPSNLLQLRWQLSRHSLCFIR